MKQTLALEVDRLHLLLDSGVGMMEALVVEGVDGLGREVDLWSFTGVVPLSQGM
jgi:hypothetical protein